MKLLVSILSATESSYIPTIGTSKKGGRNTLQLNHRNTDFEVKHLTSCRAALELDPMHVNTLYNIAVMFDTHCDRKIEAETMYRRALLEDPVHTFALYNLAVLLEERLEIEPCMVHNSSTQNSFEASRSSSIPNISHDSVGILDPSYLIEDLKGVNNMESNAFKDVAMGNIGSEEREALIKEIRSLHEQSMHLNPFDVPTIADYGR